MNYNLAILILCAVTLVSVGGCSTCHPVGAGLCIAFLHPPIGTVIGALIIIGWLVFKALEKDD